ncbi:MAG: hypothetical protein EU532_09175 [Promethearchaeota archaeon]|nr:MAG: hypothetical protein EU532_09175 [Candidatus Lokiarchaeota archaeon]
MSQENIKNKFKIRKRIKWDNNCVEVSHCCAEPCVEIRDGNEVCLNCGITFQRNYVGNERRAYDAEEIKNRRQTEPMWRDFGPRTILPNRKIDYTGNSINAKNALLFSRLSKIQRSLITSLERNLWEAKPKLKMVISKLNLPEYVKDTAWRIYCEVAKKKLTMGRSIDGFIAASLYAAIRIHEFPKVLDDVVDASMTPRHTIFRSLSLIIKEILPELNLKYHPITTEHLVYRFGNNLNLPINIQRDALNLLAIVSKNKSIWIGKDPKGLAASVIYLIAKQNNRKITQKDLASIAGITEVTLRSRIKDIKKMT